MKDGFRNNCKVCQNATTRLNKIARGSAYNSEKSRQYRETNRKRIVAYYGGELVCEHCGLKDNFFGAYDFHHLNPSIKEERIGILINKGWKSIETELKKCAVLCAICHRKEHSRLSNESNKKTCKG